jgi:hypothetical protein
MEPMPQPRPTGAPGIRGILPLRTVPIPDLAFHVGVLGVLVVLELYARSTRTDVEDAVGVACLSFLVALVRMRHSRRPLPWVNALAAAGRRVAAPFLRESAALGVDLRESPPVPRVFPPILGTAVISLATLGVLLLLLPSLEPLAARALVRAGSGALWLLLLGGAWAAFGVGSYYLLYATFALTHDELVRDHGGPGPRSRSREALCFAGWTLAVLGAWTMLPAWSSLLVQATCLAMAILSLGLPGGPDVALLWRGPGPGNRFSAASWRTHTLAGTALLALLLADTTLFLRGGGLRGEGDAGVAATLPLTAGLAALFGWTGAAALLAWCLLAVRTTLLARFRDPARSRPVPVFVADPLPAGERRRVRGALEGSGFRARFAPARPGPVDAVVVLDPGGPLPEGGIRVPRGDLASPETRRLLERRHEVRCRRALLRGLERLFRRAAARRFQRGIGFWVAPWHWFCIGLSRDEDERAVDWKEGTFFLETVGPAYHRVFPREVLAHAHRVMGDLQVDLLFVEDGVGFRRFRRVLRMAFEVHDMLGARGRAEEQHFTGLPGVRVLIHEFTMEEPFRPKRGGYPEPDYETVGRARILHVFRDRGEPWSPVDAPRDRRGVPLLA